jgi:hypothetical protein
MIDNDKCQNQSTVTHVHVPRQDAENAWRKEADVIKFEDTMLTIERLRRSQSFDGDRLRMEQVMIGS